MTNTAHNTGLNGFWGWLKNKLRDVGEAVGGSMGLALRGAAALIDAVDGDGSFQFRVASGYEPTTNEKYYLDAWVNKHLKPFTAKLNTLAYTINEKQTINEKIQVLNEIIRRIETFKSYFFGYNLELEAVGIDALQTRDELITQALDVVENFVLEAFNEVELTQTGQTFTYQPAKIISEFDYAAVISGKAFAVKHRVYSSKVIYDDIPPVDTNPVNTNPINTNLGNDLPKGFVDEPFKDIIALELPPDLTDPLEEQPTATQDKNSNWLLWLILLIGGGYVITRKTN